MSREDPQVVGLGTLDRTHKRVAVLDGPSHNADIDLYYELDGEVDALIKWPDSWLGWVSVKFLKKQGFEVVSA